MYTSSRQLAQQIRQLRQTSECSSELLSTLSQIVSGLISRYRFHLDEQEAFQEWIMLFLVKQKRIKLGGNVFSYLTTMCLNSLRQQARGEVRQVRLKARVMARQRVMVGSSGRRRGRRESREVEDYLA